jgi:anti-sigma factor RsiW
MSSSDLPEMPCRELVERLSDFFEDALPERDRKRLEAHLAECDDCAIYLEQLRETMRLAGRVELDRLKPEARDALTEAFDAWVASR